MTLLPDPAAADLRDAQAAGGPPVFDETIGGALIDSARISVMAAMQAFPYAGPPLITLPGEEIPPSILECLQCAMDWLNAARAQTVLAAPAPPTSVHVIQPAAAKKGGRS